MSDDPKAELPVPLPGIPATLLDAENAKVVAQQGRDSAASSQRLISYDSQDPSYITAMEHFEGFSHAEIHEHVKAMNIGAITTHGKTWRDIASNLSAKVLGSRLALNRALSEGFGGEFATAAATAADTFFDGADNLQRAVSAVGYRIGSVAAGAEAVRLSVPPPPVRHIPTEGTPQDALVVASMIGAASPGPDADFARQQEEQRQVAIDVMNTVYKPTYQPAGDGVPTFVPVSAPGDDSTGPGPSGSTTTTTGTGTPGSGSTTDPAGENPAGDQPASSTGEDTESTTAASTEQPTTNSTGTTSGDPQRSTPSGTTTTAGTPAYPGAPGRPSTPGSPGQPGTPQAPAPGRSVPGTPGSATAPGAATTAATRAGRPTGMGGMPGMMSPGGARKGEDEQEHQTPDYLIIDRSEELLGTEQPAVPGALGADVEAAQPAREDDYR